MVHLARWDAWRREQVSELVRAIALDARTRKPGIEISAAVIPYVDRAYLSLAQDWTRWLEENLIDFAIPMIYTLDDRLFRYQAEHFGAGARRERIWAGLGVWLFARDPARATAQLSLANTAGLANVALFSYDAMKESDGADLFAAFRLASEPDEAVDPDGR